MCGLWRTNIMLICDIIQCQIVLCSEQMPLDAWCSEIIVFFILFYCWDREWFFEKITSSEIYLNFTNLLSTDISLRSKIKGKFLEVAIVCREMVEVAFLLTVKNLSETRRSGGVGRVQEIEYLEFENISCFNLYCINL